MGIQITDAVSVDNKTIIVNSGGMLEAKIGWKEIFNFELSETLSGSNIFNIDMGSRVDFDFNKYDYMIHLLNAETDQNWHSLRFFASISNALPSTSTGNITFVSSLGNARIKGKDAGTIWLSYGGDWISGFFTTPNNRNNNLYIRISSTGSVSKFHFKIYASEKL